MPASLLHEAIDGAPLLRLARATIEAHLGLHAEPALPRLNIEGASFVTLTRHGTLRGCIGSLQAWRLLTEDVRANALAAAFHDPRFGPVTLEEWPAIRLELSILTPASALHIQTETELIAQLRPGIDGVIVESGPHRATFLPQVWAQLPDPHAFLAQLKMKAGLAAEAWSADMIWSRYQVQKWQEAD